ncbi:hypothetical protein K458DRAFT_322414 [Lentithecium fluviatile CBS 122367]|uniref:Cora-domain-containing protein n=1 Tax=Lentithecium fluviatile CBS 122367 TaxID=1168545 RepID=A0A6G1IE41_9PLEO|nr:hypothetical protein K458DRAFT_322414 [Lentithecium fluviatile CBS 122367]
MMFLRGLPSPEWLATMGAMFRVDPAFFQTHMELPSSFNRKPTFSHPPLPSAARNVLQLRYVSIGLRHSKNEADHGNIDDLRRTTETEMEQYHVNLGIPKYRKPGDAIVRSYNIHDAQYFSVEQRISMCKLETPWGWLNIVWLDSGNDLSEGPQGPWLKSNEYYSNWKSTFLPTIQHLPGIALNRKWHDFAIPGQHHLNGRFNQSASLLPENYGQSLDKSLAATDSFYAFHELFSFSANSLCQFLNLIESIIMAETGYHSVRNQHFSQLNLLYHQDILNRLARVLQETLRGIQSVEGHTEETHRALVLVDFKELLARTDRLIKRCASGMEAVMNRAMIAESKRAISQAKKIEQLTWLATFYIPLSFMTSFFGMNLGNVGKGQLPLWMWFASAIPVTMLSFAAIRLLAWYLNQGVRKLE